jgi:hypothetical protein
MLTILQMFLYFVIFIKNHFFNLLNQIVRVMDAIYVDGNNKLNQVEKIKRYLLRKR